MDGKNILTNQSLIDNILQQIKYKREALIYDLKKYKSNSTDKKQDAYDSLDEALKYISDARNGVSVEFLSNPIGSSKVHHRDVVENIEIQIANATSVIKKLNIAADIDTISRNSPEDYFIKRSPTQSKFIIGGVIAGGKSVYKKLKSGKQLCNFTTEDWREAGVDFGKGAVKGGIKGAGILSLTQLGDFSAPYAGAIVSTAIGITSLAMDYKAGKISESDFCDAACALSVESGLVAVGSAIGSSIIPIPVVGSAVGAMSARAASEVSKEIFGLNGKAFAHALERRYYAEIADATAQAKIVLENITRYYSKMHGLISTAFDRDENVRMFGSIELCRHVGVPEHMIIHNHNELDKYILG